MCYNKNEFNGYKSLNKMAKKNSCVIVGSSYMKQMPVGELRQIFGILSDIYNRSLTNLSVFEAEEIITEIINEMVPKKLVLQLGEIDLENGKTTVDEVIDQISKIITTAKKIDKHLKIVFVSINNLTDKEIEDEYNKKLEKLAIETKNIFADISSAPQDDVNHIQTFRLLKYFMTDDFSFRIM